MTKSTGTRRRANGEGSIFPYRDRWRGAVTWTDADGIRHKRVVTSKVKGDVRREVARLRAALDQGIAPPPRTTVADFLATWLDASHQRIRHSTWRGYESCVRVYLVPAFGSVELGKLTPTQVERMTAGLIASGHAPRTAALARTVLRLALGDAVRDGLVARNVAALARPPYVPTRTLEAGRDYLDGAQLRKLVTAAKVHPMGPLVTLAAMTGLRLGELLGLEWHDVSDTAGTLTVRRSMARTPDGYALSEPKTKRSRRTIDLPAVAIAALDRQRELQGVAKGAVGTAWQDMDGLIFTDPVGRPLRGATVNHVFHRILEAAALPSIPFHGLRHSAATAMLAAGVPLKVVSDQLGHATITITADKYAGTTPALRRSAADAMDAAMGGA
jgi:integrase